MSKKSDYVTWSQVEAILGWVVGIAVLVAVTCGITSDYTKRKLREYCSSRQAHISCYNDVRDFLEGK